MLWRNESPMNAQVIDENMKIEMYEGKLMGRSKDPESLGLTRFFSSWGVHGWGCPCSSFYDG